MNASAKAAAKAAAAKPLPLQLLERQLKAADPSTRGQGLDTVNTVPVPVEALSNSLVELLEHENLYVKQTAVEAIARTATAKNRSCVLALDMVGPRMKHEQNPEIGRQAAAALLRVTECAEPGEPPVEQLHEVSAADKRKGAPMPPGPAKTASIKVASFLEDEDPRTRQRAIELLVQMGPLAAPYSEQFAGMLADQDHHVRGAVIKAFTDLGVEVQDGIKKTGELVGHSDPSVRRAAGRAITALAAHSGPEAAEAVLPVLQSPDPVIRIFALEVMASLGPLSAPHGRTLTKLLADKTPRVRDAAVRALVAAGPRVVACLKEIKKLVLCDTPEWRAAAESAMKGLAPHSAHFAAAASSMLRDHQTEDGAVVFQGYHRLHALRILSGAEENAVPYLNDVVNELDRRDWQLRRAAMEALEDLGPHGQKAAKEVSKRLSSHDRDIRRAAAETLGRMGKNAGLFGQQLVGTLRLESDKDVRNACEDAVARLKEAGALDANA